MNGQVLENWSQIQCIGLAWLKKPTFETSPNPRLTLRNAPALRLRIFGFEILLESPEMGYGQVGNLSYGAMTSRSLLSNPSWD